MKPSSRAGLLALSTVVCFAAGCEDMPAGPDLEALVESRSRAGASGLSLQDLFAVAVVRVQRIEGSDTADAVLARWRDATEMPVDGDADAIASQQRIRQLEAQTVIRAFGPGVVGQAHLVVAGELQQLRPAAERALGNDGGEGSVRAALDSVAAALDHAAGLRSTAPADALVAVARAADRLGTLRTALADTDRFPTLEELHAAALDSLRAAGAGVRADSVDAAVLSADSKARQAQEMGSLDGAYRALEEARATRASTVAEVLGPDAASTLIAALHEATAELRARFEERQSRALDVARELRMLQTATDLLHRADAAAAAGEPSRSIDLATHAAGLINELRRQLAR